MIGRIVRFFGDAEHAKRRRWLLAATLLAVFVADFFVAREHVDFFWDAISGWAAAVGFVSCVAIIFASKLLGHQGRIMRDEDYYD
ncbi:MAG: hypothetical protein ACE5KL_08280 [Alphaproteobacteria bacterium]